MAFCHKRFEKVLVAIISASLVCAFSALTQHSTAQGVVQRSSVKLSVLVTDSLNRPVGDVRQDELRVFEDGAPQTISFFSKEEAPVIYGLVIDNSGSLKGKLSDVVEAGKSIVSGNKAEDETLLVRFVGSDRIENVQDFTSTTQALRDALDELYIEEGQTALVDAVYVSTERVTQQKKTDSVFRRRALILITDGEDRASFYKEEQLLKRLRENDVQVFAIGLVGDLRGAGPLRRGPRGRAISFLRRLAEETGGRALFPNTSSELLSAADLIARYLRMQYVVGYNPPTKKRNNSFRRVQVKLADTVNRKKHTASTRAGYVRPVS